jgi:hypothetical protein
MFRLIAVFLMGVSIGFVGSILYAIWELGKSVQP